MSVSLEDLGIEDVDPEMLCGEHAEPSIIQTLSIAEDGDTVSPRIYRIVGCWNCCHVLGYISGIADANRFSQYQ